MGQFEENMSDASSSGVSAKSMASTKADTLRPTRAGIRPSMQTRHSMNGPLYMQSGNRVLVRRPKRKNETAMQSITRWLLDNQTGFSFNLIALIFLAHACIPKARQHTSKFFSLSYYNSTSGEYAVGFDDAYFIAFCIVLLTGLRAGFMEHALSPLARQWGLSKKKEVTRFAEQGWMFLYYLVFWPLGMYIYCRSPYYLNMSELWTNWPNRELTGLVKGYLLTQWGFWLQQIFVLHIEERRKDHYQMLAHHVITISLIFACYTYHHTKVGNLILIQMDIGDLFLSTAKCLKYMGFSTICDVTFGLFMLSWVVCRHIFYNMTLYSIWKDVPQIITNGCFYGNNSNLQGPIPAPEGWSYLLEPFKNPEGLVCYNESVQQIFLATLLGLQVITLVWFVLVIKVAIKVVTGKGAEDVRSDDECDEEEEEEETLEYEEAQPLEEEVGIEGIDLKNWERRAGIKRATSSTGVSLPGHSDRKELLGRIGCEKQVD